VSVCIDVLGTVSDEDILKLTQLTSILPEISTTSNQHYHYHSHKTQPNNSKYLHSSITA
jgi:hypothetical protein